MFHFHILPIFLLILLLLIRYAHAAFVETYECPGINYYEYSLAPFIVDVALDEDKQKLKFYMNSQVISYSNMSNTDVVINDVNQTTNRYTTFHVEIKFMGNTFINENKRFCDVIAVKNTSSFLKSPRFTKSTSVGDGDDDNNGDNTSSSDSIGASAATDHSSQESDISISNYHDHNNTTLNSKRDLVSNNSSISMSTTNATIDRIFNNSTGDLVQCPLYLNDSIVLYYEADISSHFHRLGSYAARFSVVSNDDSSNVIGCNRAYITPVQSDYITDTLFIGILVLLLTTAAINCFTIINSSYQESSNPFLFTASTICNKNLLRQLDATVNRIIKYLQFALFIGGLDVQYPGFYQPIIGQIRWCSLLGISLIRSPSKHRGKSQTDNIYVTLNRGGLKSLALYSTDQSIHSSWPNFMLCLTAWICISILLQQMFLGFKRIIDYLIKKHTKDMKLLSNDEENEMSNFQFTLSKNLYYILGQIFNNFLSVFAFPFLILTSYLFFSASNLNGKHIFFPSLKNLKRNAFASQVSYSDLFSPDKTDVHSSESGFSSKTPSPLPPSPSATLNPSISSILLSLESSHPTGGNIPLLHPNMNSTVGKSSNHPRTEYLGIPTLSVVLAALFFTAWLVLVLLFIFKYIVSFKNFKMVMNKRVPRLYTSMKSILIWAFCYHHYHPKKVYYVGIEYTSLFLKLILIGCLQDHGLIQVVCLLVVEFIDLLLLFLIQPYYLEMTWTTARWILPMARFCVTALCIPYIKELNIGEATRTYVAYAQLLIHAVMALMFIFQLLYCFVSTLCSIFKDRREKRQYRKYSSNANDNASDDFNKQFEYQPIRDNIEPLVKSDGNIFPLHYDSAYENLLTYGSIGIGKISEKSDIDRDVNLKMLVNDNVSDEEEELGDDYYYRGKQIQEVNSSPKRNNTGTKPIKNFDYPYKLPVVVTSDGKDCYPNSNDLESDTQSFQKQQQRSNLRKRENDYTFREADLIYRKYFVDAEIDPEIKALWDSRHNWDFSAPNPANKGEDVDRKDQLEMQNEPYRQQSPKKIKSTSILDNFKNIFFMPHFSRAINKKEGVSGSFQVSRPRRLVVKSPSEMQEKSFSNSDSEESLIPLENQIFSRKIDGDSPIYSSTESSPTKYTCSESSKVTQT